MTIVACSRCGAPVDDSNQYCGKCGSKASFPAPQFYTSLPSSPNAPAPHATGKAFDQMFGIDPRIAMLTLIVDAMLFGGEVMTGGVLIFFSLFVGAVLGFVAYRAQMKWYGDDRESALIKGVILGLLTAIPTPLPALLSVPSGILGLVHNIRNIGKKRIGPTS